MIHSRFCRVEKVTQCVYSESCQKCQPLVDRPFGLFSGASIIRHLRQQHQADFSNLWHLTHDEASGSAFICHPSGVTRRGGAGRQYPQIPFFHFFAQKVVIHPSEICRKVGLAKQQILATPMHKAVRRYILLSCSKTFYTLVTVKLLSYIATINWQI